MPAASATPPSWAMRLAALLMPDASPSSASATLDRTAAVIGAAITANETPSSAMGPITPKQQVASCASAIQT